MLRRPDRSPVTGHPLRLHTEDDIPRPEPGELLLELIP
jgi:hypothetical protein